MTGYAGSRIGRLDGFDKASGRAKYAADFYMDGLLELALVRSERVHANILSVDFSGLPEDVFLFSAKDIKQNIIEDIIEDQPVLALDKVRFLGEPIAIVAADSRAKAKEAVKCVKITYEDLPVIDTAKQSYQAGAYKIHESGNVLSEFHNQKGDVDSAFSVCDLLLEDDFSLPVQDHACMEPEACFSYLDNGVLHILASTQNVFHDKRMIMRSLDLPQDKVQVRAATVGGGFGGKDGHTVQIFTALVTLKTGRPAKLVFDRSESLLSTYKRHAADLHVKIGFKNDGTITAFDGTSYLDTGAYAGLGTAVLGLFCEHFAGPYVIENVRISAHLMYTNKAPAHAMRGFGAPQGAFATETLINKAAYVLKLDPISIRKQNALSYHAIGALEQAMEHSVGLKEALELVENSDLWKEQSQNTDPCVGYGVAAGHLSCGLGKNIPDTATVEIESENDGAIVKVGLVDIGQGSMTAIAAIAADALELPLNKIRMIMADTEITHDCGSTAGSRSTFIAGNAILNAAKEFKERRAKGENYIKVAASAAFPESKKSFATPGFPHAMYTFIAQAVKLRIDPVCGSIKLLDIFAATEAGRVINQLSLDGQMQGGIAMSIGYALMEDCRYQNGIPMNRDFSTYLLPSALDVPQIKNVSVSMVEQSGPMGAKGAAEVATVAIAPAIGCAVHSVSGEWQTALPIRIKISPNRKVEVNKNKN